MSGDRVISVHDFLAADWFIAADADGRPALLLITNDDEEQA